MTKKEARRLVRLASKFQKAAHNAENYCSKNKRLSGKSDVKYWLGDEGWKKHCELGGKAEALHASAEMLVALVNKFKSEDKKLWSHKTTSRMKRGGKK